MNTDETAMYDLMRLSRSRHSYFDRVVLTKSRIDSLGGVYFPNRPLSTLESSTCLSCSTNGETIFRAARNSFAYVTMLLS